MFKSTVLHLTNAQNVRDLPVPHGPCESVFSSKARAFTAALSRQLLDVEYQQQSELVALGFWLRKSNIQQQFATSTEELRKPIGLVVHYCPANVDTMFVYSWICSLIVGNANVVRLNSTLSALQTLLIDAIFSVLNQQEFKSLALANVFVQYDKENEAVANALSQLADGRIIWGGDESVLSIRQLPIKPRCRDISFANRYSASLIDSECLTSNTVEKLAEGFYRDLHPFEQQACSSPKIVFWLGREDLMDKFFSKVDSLFNKPTAITLKNEQLVMQQSLALAGRAHHIRRYNTISVVMVKPQAPLDFSHHSGNFTLWVVPLTQLCELERYADEKLQTLTYAGIKRDELVKFLAKPSITGVDRIVPIGSALSFSQNWDGYELTNQLTRRIEVL